MASLGKSQPSKPHLQFFGFRISDEFVKFAAELWVALVFRVLKLETCPLGFKLSISDCVKILSIYWDWTKSLVIGPEQTGPRTSLMWPEWSVSCFCMSNHNSSFLFGPSSCLPKLTNSYLFIYYYYTAKPAKPSIWQLWKL